jgi:uncharacterized protein (TIGR03435 family)
MRYRPSVLVRAWVVLVPALLAAQTRIGQPSPPLRLGSFVQGSPADLYPTHAKLIEFWATGCIPCRENIPHLNQLADQFKNRDIDFISLSRDPSDMIEHFLREHPIHGIVTTDPDATLADALGVLGVPATALIDQGGRIAAVTEPSLVNARVLEALLTQQSLPLTPDEADTRVLKRRLLFTKSLAPDADATARVVVHRAMQSSVSAYVNGQYETSGRRLRDLLADAYDLPAMRIDMPPYLEQLIFAVQAWAPPHHPETLRPLMQAALLAGASIQVRTEQREAEVTVMSGLPGKLRSCPADQQPQGGFHKPGDISVECATAEMLRTYVEMGLGNTVILDNLPTGKFGLIVTWDPAHPDELESTLRDRFGFNFHRERRMVTFLVVKSLDGE